MSVLSSMYRASQPTVAVELTSTRVSAASVEMRAKGAVVSAHAVEALPPGALAPSLTTSNVRDQGAIVSALGRVLDQIGGRPRRVGLVVPDSVAKVSIVRFEQVPGRRQDLDQLIRWQVKKTAPFPIEDAQVSFAPGLTSSDGHEFIVSLARREVIEEYERVSIAVGAHPGLVDLSTFSVVNAVLAGTPGAGDWLLVHVSADYASIVILRGEHPIFFRNRTSDGDGTLIDLVHQAAMYYEDRLSGSGFGRVMLVGAGGTMQTGELEQLRRGLEARLARPIEALDPRSAATLTDRLTASAPLLDTLAPLVGLLVRGQEVSA